MKRIGLVIAAAALGTTGVASAGIAVQQFSASSHVSNESVALDAKTAGLAANCWIATGASKAAGCNTSASPTLPGLPGIDEVTNLVNAQSLIDTAKGIAGGAAAGVTNDLGALANPTDAVNGAVGTASGAVGTATGSVNGTVSAATGAVNGAVKAGTGAVNGAVKAGTDVVNGVVGSAGQVVNGATGVAGNAATGATGAVNGVVSGATGAVNNTLGGVTGTVNGLLGGGLLNCSASGGVSTGLLGSISLSGSC